MACLKNIFKISNHLLLRRTNILPYLPIVNSLHVCHVDNSILSRISSFSDQGSIRRTLYTNESLGIDKFEKDRKLMKQQYEAGAAESFRSKMQDLLDRSKKTHMLVFKQDLERVIYLSDNEEEHLELIKEMALKYASQNSNLRFGNFSFGPILIRLCFVLDRPDLALEMVSNPELNPLFSSPSSYQLLMSLLYRHQLYTEVLDLMKQISTGRVISQRYPRSCVLLSLASALKMGTEEGHDRGLALAEAAQASTIMPRRFFALVGTIALHAGRPDTAIKMLQGNKWPNYYTIRNIMVLAWCELGRLDQVVALLRPLTHQDSGGMHVDRSTVFQATFDKVKDAIEEKGDPALMQEFSRIEKALHDRKLVNNRDLVECVLEPLDMSETAPRNEQRVPQNRSRRRYSLMDDPDR